MTTKKKYPCPVLYSVSGWVEIEAENLADAKAKAEKMNDEGFDQKDIRDPDFYSECFVDEIEPSAEEDNQENE